MSVQGEDEQQLHGMQMEAIRGEQSTNQETLASNLAPIDGGKQAWVFLLASFVFEFIIWGQAYGYGAYLDYHINNSSSPLYGQSTASISAIGTLVIGGQHFVPLLARGFFRSYPRLIRSVSTVCIALSALCIFLASFMDKVVYLLLFQGIFYGICSGITFTPVILWLPQWFDKRRGLASGIIYSGSGLGGIVFPLIITKLLNTLGFAWTLRVMALLSLVLGSLASMALKPRLPIVPASESRFSIGQLLPGNLNALFSPFAGFSQLVVFLQAGAWYTISLYISSYTTSLGFSSSTATIVLSAFNASATIGLLAMGRLIDVTPYNIIMISSATICSLSTWICKLPPTRLCLCTRLWSSRWWVLDHHDANLERPGCVL
jgi:MFS family permease